MTKDDISKKIRTFLITVTENHPFSVGRKKLTEGHTKGITDIGRSIGLAVTDDTISDAVAEAFTSAFESIGEFERRLNCCDYLIDILTAIIAKYDSVDENVVLGESASKCTYLFICMRANANKEKNYFISKLWKRSHQLEQVDSEVKKAIITTKKSLDEVKTIEKKMSSELNKINLAIKKTDNTAKTIDKKVSDVLTQSITILSIFAVILMTFFSGIVLVDSFRILAEEPSTQRFIFVLLITGHVLLMLIFMFMHFVSRLVEKSLGAECTDFKLRKDITYERRNDAETPCSCCIFNINTKFFNRPETNEDEKSPESLNVRCSSLGKLKKKYPYVLYTNAILFSAEIFVLIWWFSEKYLFRRHSIYTNEPLWVTFLLVLLIVAIVLTIVLFVNARNAMLFDKTQKNKKNSVCAYAFIIILCIGIVVLAFYINTHIHIRLEPVVTQIEANNLAY